MTSSNPQKVNRHFVWSWNFHILPKRITKVIYWPPTIFFGYQNNRISIDNRIDIWTSLSEQELVEALYREILLKEIQFLPIQLWTEDHKSALISRYSLSNSYMLPAFFSDFAIDTIQTMSHIFSLEWYDALYHASSNYRHNAKCQIKK